MKIFIEVMFPKLELLAYKRLIEAEWANPPVRTIWFASTKRDICEICEIYFVITILSILDSVSPLVTSLNLVVLTLYKE